jgi:tetratricopeptide (TPR) repeat protein
MQKAISLYDECLNLDPLNLSYNTQIVYNKACAVANTGDSQKALLLLESAIKMNPGYVKAYFKRGDILLA